MKTIIEMAREADSGFEGGEDADGTMGDSIVGLAAIKRFAELVRADEREACAKVCDDKYAEYPEIDPDYAFALAASDLAKTIRARGQA